MHAYVIVDPAFDGFGDLIFPLDSNFYAGDTLGNLTLTWYSHIDPKMTVRICNYFKNQVMSGNQIFYDIYIQRKKERIIPSLKILVCSSSVAIKAPLFL